MAKINNGGKGTEVKKSVCPITRSQFNDKAKSLKVTVDGQDRIAEAKEFSTGTLGWYMNEKLTIEVDGVPVKVQANVQFFVVGSKDLPAVEDEAGSDDGDEDLMLDDEYEAA